MTAVGSTRLVAAREIRETTRRKSFWIVLVVLALAATAAVVVPTLLDDDGTRYRVAVVGDRAGLGEALTTSLAGLDATVHTSSIATTADAELAVDLELIINRFLFGAVEIALPVVHQHMEAMPEELPLPGVAPAGEPPVFHQYRKLLFNPFAIMFEFLFR